MADPANTTAQPAPPAQRTWPGVALIAAACLAAGLPAFDNGFISDDYVHLEWVELLADDPTFLFGTPPIGFRPTSFVTYLVLKKVFGFVAPIYYAAALLVHFLTCLLVARFCFLVTEDRRISLAAALAFAVIYQSQEPLYYIASINESLMVLFGLAALVLYHGQRNTLAAAAFVLALLSKESAVILPLLAALVQYGVLRRRPRRTFLLVFVTPALLRVLLLVYFASDNYYVNEGIHALSPALPSVLLLSLHKLTFPWLPLVLIGAAVTGPRSSWRAGLNSRTLGWALWPATALLPYATLTYQAHVTSRHYYLAAVGWVILLSILAYRLLSRRLATVLLASFIAVNIGYTWVKKDRQFEQRAAETNFLLDILRSTEPTPISISGFPGNPWNARLTTRLVDGWEPHLLRVNEPPGATMAPIRLRWEHGAYRRLE